MPRDVAVVSFAKNVVPHSESDDVEMLAPAVAEALAAARLQRRDVGFTVSASCDYLGGRPFSFVMALDAIGAWPPIRESHVEMDGAWALYEAWVALQHGDIDVAMVYAFGRSTQGDLYKVLGAQLDPYTVGPLGVDVRALAALQARAMIDAGQCTERDMASVVARSRGGDVDALLREPQAFAPLRPHDCAAPADGVAVAVLAAGDRARACCDRPAWIRGIDHRIDAHALGVRDLTRAPSAEIAARGANVAARAPDVAELDAPFSHQEILLRKALGLAPSVKVNPSGGPLGEGWPYVVSGLLRVGAAAQRIHAGEASRAVAHATSGPCLQQNLVCVLETE
jgi:acetyl-CoA acetyltransferase